MDDKKTVKIPLYLLWDLEEQIRREEPKRFKELTRWKMVQQIIKEAENV